MLKMLIFLFPWQDPVPVPPAVKTKEDVLLFFKLYNPEKEELR